MKALIWVASVFHMCHRNKVGFLYWLISIKDKSFTLNCLRKLSLKSYINKNPPFCLSNAHRALCENECRRCLSSPLGAARQQHPKTVRKSSGLENIDQTLVKYSLHTEPRTHTLCFTSHCSSFLEQLAGVLSVIFFLLSPPRPPSSPLSRCTLAATACPRGHGTMQEFVH